MQAFRDLARRRDTRDLVARARRHAEGGRALALLLLAGRIEQAGVDHLAADRDGWGPPEARLRAATCAAAGAWLAAEGLGGDGPVEPLLRRAAVLLEAATPGLPATLETRVPEGFVHYGLDPAVYAAAARSHARAAGPERAGRSMVVGIRSIGTTLGAVVAAALGDPPSATVRPRGPIGARRIVVAEPLARCVLRAVAGGGEILVVDEGPGATGETFACAAAWLRRIGVPPGRTVLFPSRDGGMSLAPESRRTWFGGARKVLPPPGDRLGEGAAARAGVEPVADLSAGLWRRRVPGGGELPARTVLERRKLLARDGRGGLCILRFAGLGEASGAARRSRRLAERLTAGGEGSAGAPAGGALGAAEPCAHGFIARPWIPGRPLTRRELAAPRRRPALGRYAAVRSALFGTGEPVRNEVLVSLLVENGAEALGGNHPGLAAAARALEVLPEAEAVRPDARLQPWEWLETPAGRLVKVDGVDHGDDCRLPGPTHRAWDPAGLTVELAWDDATAAELAAACADAAGEPVRAFVEAMDAVRPAYAAAALGDACMAAWDAPDDRDRRLLLREAALYGHRLARELRRVAERRSGWTGVCMTSW